MTMRDVARAAGVAPMTVSYTYTRPDRVAADTRERVLATAARLGYAGPDPVARSLRSGSPRSLGVVFGEHLSYAFEDPGAARFLAGVSRVCVDNQLGLVLIPTTGKPEDVDRVREAIVRGFVLWTTEFGDPVLDAVAAARRPAAIQGGPATPGIRVVAADDRMAAKSIAREILLQSERPLILSHPLDRARWSGVAWGQETEVAFPVTRARLSGYRDAVESLGGEWGQVAVAVAARNTREEGRRVVNAALERFRPDAVVAMSDQLAAGAHDALGSSALLSGWDDSDVSLELNFSSVRQSLYDQGVACANIAAGIVSTIETPPWVLIRR